MSKRSGFIALTALLAGSVRVGTSAAQSCTSPTLGRVLDSGVVAPPLWTESGPPVIGSAFSLGIRNGTPGGRGVLAWSSVQLPRTLSFASGLFYPGAPLSRLPFQLDASGNAPALLTSPPLPPELCGVEVFLQAALLGGTGGGGITLSNALHLRCGAPSPGPFQQAQITLPSAEFAPFDVDGDGRTDLIARQTYPGGPFGPELQQYHVLRNVGNGTFAPGPLTQTTVEFSPFLAADFDADGFGDVATGAVLLRGNPTPELTVAGGTFAASFHEPRAFGDLDGDGRLDLVGSAFPGLATALNAGGGSFVPGPTTATAVGVVALGHFDGDARLDAAVGAPSGAFVTLWLGNGDGSFRAGSGFATPGPVLALEARDLDGDSLDDLILGYASVEVMEVRRCLGSGAFDLPLGQALPEVARSLELADLDADGRVDLLVNHASLLLGRGDGSFDAPAHHGVASLEAVLLDVDLDGRLDVLGADGTLHRGLAGGVLSASLRPILGLSAAEDVAAGDLDGDGLDDVVVPDRHVDTLRYSHARDGRRFGAEQVVAAGNGPNRVVLGDLDLDGDLDALVGHASQSALLVLRGDGLGSLQPAGSHPVGGSVSELALADLDADGRADVVATHLGLDAGFSVALGNGDATFQASATRTVRGDSLAVVTGQFLGTADTDVLVLRALNSNHGVLSFAGNGDGTFATAVLTTTTHNMAFVVPRHMSAGDGDRDGDLDLFISAYDGVNEYQLLWRQNANGTFGVQSRSVLEIRQNALADFSGDGKPDLVATSGGFSPLSGLRYFEGNGNMGFPDLGLRRAQGWDSGPIALGQFDRNGTMDVAVVNAYGRDLWVTFNSLGD